jgi:formamidopyrimidine-DNA glycosylase
MPEHPEVGSITRGLRQSILGWRILSAQLGKTDSIDDPATLRGIFRGAACDAVERYRKFRLLRLSEALNPCVNLPRNGDAAPAALLVRLGMRGQLALCRTALPCAKHTQVWMRSDEGREMRYTDPRRLGRVAYLADKAPKELTAFGAELLEVTAVEFAAYFREGSSAIGP